MRLPRTPLLVLGLLGTAAVVPALAQTSAPSSYPPACEDAKVTKADRDRAHTVFLSGKQFLEESNYDKAISYFKDAYAIDCSVHGILPIIATAYERKGDKREAIRALDEYQKRAPAAPDHEVIERRIRNLKDQLAQEQASASAALPSAGAPPPLLTAPPETSASAFAPPLTPPPSPQEEASRHTLGPWIVAGVGGALLVGGVVTYAVGAGKVSNAETICGPQHDNCPRGPTGSSAIDDGNTGRSLEVAGVVVGSAGAAAVAAGLIWHFVEHPRAPSATPATGLRILPEVAPGYAGLSLGGGFD